MEPRTRLLGLTFLLGLGLFLGAKYVLPLVAPFVVGLILASLIEPAVDWLGTRWGLPRWLAASGVLSLTAVLAGVILGALGIQLWLGLRRLVASATRCGWFADALARLGRSSAGALAGLPEPLRAAFVSFLRELPGHLAGVLERLLSGLGRLPQWAVFFFLGMIAAYFFSRDRELVGRHLLRLVPREWRGRALAIKDELLLVLGGFLRAEAVLIGMTVALGTGGLALLGVDQAVLLGAALGLLDFLPMIGPGALLLPWAGACLVLGAWGRGLGLIFLFATLAVAREALEARLVGRSLGLHPLAVLAAFYVGVRLFGLGGFILGPLLLVVMRALYETLALPGRLSWNGVAHEASCHPRFHGVHRPAGPGSS